MAEVFDDVEAPLPEEVLVEDADEALGAAIAMKGQEAFAPICVPSMFDSLEVEVLYPA